MPYAFSAKKGNMKNSRIITAKRVTSANNSRRALVEAGYRVSKVYNLRIQRKQQKRRVRRRT